MPVPHLRRARRQLGSILLSTVAFAALCTGAAQAGGAPAPSPMETIAFPVTTDSPAARVAFERGMVALHSFAYSDAVEAFGAATAANPGFVMGYWGEAMALNRPVWNEQDTAGGRTAVAKLEAVRLPAKLTPRERALMAAVPLLYRGEDKRARNRPIGRQWSGSAVTSPRTTRSPACGLWRRWARADSRRSRGRQSRAADARRRAGAGGVPPHPNHPGAAHYAIHALDDPEHAILALPAAQPTRRPRPTPIRRSTCRRTSSSSWGCGGARAANEAAWASSLDWAARKSPPSAQRDTHSLSWLGFIQLQEGRTAAATATLATLRGTAKVKPTMEVRVFYYAQLAGSLLAETGGWRRAAALYDPVVPKGQSSRASRPDRGHRLAAQPRRRRGRRRLPRRRYPAAPSPAPEPSYLFGAVATGAYFRGLAAVLLAARPTPGDGSGRWRR